MIQGQNFDRALPEIIINGDITILGSVNNTTPNLDPVDGNLNDQGTPSGTIPGESDTKFTDIRELGQFMYQYIKVPVTANPTTVTITVPSGTVVHYTYGPQYPTARVDNINCFEYTGPIVLTNNKSSDGTFIYAVAFKTDTNNKPTQNDQSPLLIAQLKVTK